MDLGFSGIEKWTAPTASQMDYLYQRCRPFDDSFQNDPLSTVVEMQVKRSRVDENDAAAQNASRSRRVNTLSAKDLADTIAVRESTRLATDEFVKWSTYLFILAPFVAIVRLRRQSRKQKSDRGSNDFDDRIIEVADEQTRWDKLLRVCYWMRQSWLVKIALHAVVLVHLGTIFFEAPTFELSQRQGLSPQLFLVEICCVLVEILFWLSDLTVRYGIWRFKVRVAFEKVSTSVRIRFVLTILGGVVLLGAILVNAICAYNHLGSIEYYVPLRPLLLIILNQRLRVEFVNFLLTLAEVASLFVIYGLAVLVFACLGLVLFAEWVLTPGFSTYESSYTNIFRALISTFTFVNMAPNFTKVVGPSVDVSPFYYLYWVPLSFLAICFILGLFVGQFQAVFTRRRQRRAAETERRECRAAIAAFFVVDLDLRGKLTKEEMCKLGEILGVTSLVEEELEKRKTPTVDILTFHEVLYGQLSEDWAASLSSIADNGVMHRRLWYRDHMEVWECATTVLIFFQIFSATLYELRSNQDVDVALAALFLLSFLEVVARMWIWGFGLVRNFWNLESLQGPNRHHSFTRSELFSMTILLRFDTIVMVSSICGFVVSLLASGFVVTPITRFFLVLPILRVFVIVSVVRDIVITFSQLFTQFIAVFFLVMILIFTYAIIGVNLLSQRIQYDILPNPPPGKFDTLAQALQSLYMSIEGQGWNSLMYSAINATRGAEIAVYFVTFMVFLSSVLINIFIGLVVETVSLDSNNKNKNKNKR